MKISILLITVAVALVLAGVGYWQLTGRTVAPVSYDDFAKCLTEKNVVMYGAYWCPHCQNQKEMFGNSWQYINYVECDPRGNDAKPGLCQQNNIEFYPTWIINGKKYAGEQSLEILSSLTGCSLSE